MSTLPLDPQIRGSATRLEKSRHALTKDFDPDQPRDDRGRWTLAPGKSRSLSFDKAHKVFSSTLADLKTGEAVDIEAPNAMVRNASVTAVHLGGGSFDVQDERVGDEGPEDYAEDTASSMISEVEDNAPGVKRMVVRRYVEPDVDPKTGEWL